MNTKKIKTEGGGGLNAYYAKKILLLKEIH